jgi:hypothetical protein
LRKERPPGSEIDGDRARLPGADVRHAQCAGELNLEPAARARKGGGREKQSDDCRRGGGETERHGLPLFKQVAKRQAAWVGPLSKMGHETHSSLGLAV